MTSAGIVLAGGLSSRMARPKASLPWHGSTLLGRVTSLVGRAVDGPVVVVASPGQSLPALPAGVEVVVDAVSAKGPLAGIAAGLAALHVGCEVAFVTSTDVPFLHPSFVTRVLDGCTQGFEICAPVVGGNHQPLAAAYRTSVLAAAEGLLAGGQLRVSLLFERCATRRVDESWFFGNQLALGSTHNLNYPGDYIAALARPQPEVDVGGRIVRASDLGGAVAAAGVRLGTHVSLNGALVLAEPGLALVTGDTVALA